MSMRPRALKWLAIPLALGAIAGCTRGTADLHHWVSQQQDKEGDPLPAMPVVKTFESFVYKDQDKRDPFVVGVSDREAAQQQNGPHPNRDRPEQPLEKFALDSLEMVGTIGTDTNRVALIQDPGDRIHRIHVNQYMGQNYGHVTDITKDHVDLVELVPNGNGGWRERDTSVALSTD